MYNGAEKRIGKGRFCREFAVKTNKIMDLNTVKTVVVKIGTSTLTYENGKMNLRRIDKLCRTLCDLQNGGRRIVLVTSGAIGVGMGKLGLPERPDDTAKKQALAAIGQCELMFAYDKFFGEYHQNVAQVLLTADVTSQPISRRNVENTFRELLDMNVIPIVNENDTVAVDELEGRNFGDNDTLSAIVAGIINADVLMILTDIDGVYDKNPKAYPDENSRRRDCRACKYPDIYPLRRRSGEPLPYFRRRGHRHGVHAVIYRKEHNAYDRTSKNGRCGPKSRRRSAHRGRKKAHGIKRRRGCPAHASGRNSCRERRRP